MLGAKGESEKGREGLVGRATCFGWIGLGRDGMGVLIGWMAFVIGYATMGYDT